MMRAISLCIATLAVVLGACQGSGSPSCSFNGGTQLAGTTWPKFRADQANTGRAAVDLTTSSGTPAVLFQAHCSVTLTQSCTADTDCMGSQTCVPIGSIAATPVIGLVSGINNIFLASNDETVYVLDVNGQPVPALRSNFAVSGAGLGTPLAGADGTLFVPGAGLLVQFNSDGTTRNRASINGIVSGSPNIWDNNGTTYIGSKSGILEGICPNGVARFAASFPPTQSTAAVVQDPNVAPTDVKPIAVGGGANGLVRAYDIRGRQYYAFFATADIIAAVMVDELRTPPVFYVADTNGRVFAVNLTNGQRPTNSMGSPIFSFTANAGITASPALSRDLPNGSGGMMPGPTMYVADLSGVLYALNRMTGEVIWTFQAEGPISSSPAVATGGAQDVIVFAADILDPVTHVPTESRVYAIRDDGTTGTSLWRSQDGRDGMPACGVVGSLAAISLTAPTSSPAIGSDGTVYLGLQSLSNSAAECETVVLTNGGGLVAFGP